MPIQKYIMFFFYLSAQLWLRFWKGLYIAAGNRINEIFIRFGKPGKKKNTENSKKKKKKQKDRYLPRL